MGHGRLFIVEIGSHVSDVRVRQANDLSRVTGVGKDFLISGETRIEHDFTAAPRDGSGGAPAENSTVFERKYPWPYGCFCQRVLYPAGYNVAATPKRSAQTLARTRAGSYFPAAAITGIEPK